MPFATSLPSRIVSAGRFMEECLAAVERGRDEAEDQVLPDSPSFTGNSYRN